MEDMEDSFVPILTPLIDGSSCLEAVALRDHDRRWQPGPECPLLIALADKASLKRLDCTYAGYPFCHCRCYGAQT